MNDLLEIGSVVELREDTYKLMIIGYLPFDEEESKVYDYLCIPHLLGMFGNVNLHMINHNMINKVLFRGYRNEKSEQLLGKIRELSECNDINHEIILSE